MARRSVFAKDVITDRIVHISEVPVGYQHAICSDCKAQMTSSNYNQDSRKVACYFKHASGGKGCSSMTMLHEFAQQILRDRGLVRLPDFNHSVYPKNPKNHLPPLEVNREGYQAYLSKPSLEKPYPTERGLKADVHGMEPDVGDLFVEIWVHHEVDKAKKAVLETAHLDVIQIDLRDLVDEPDLTKEQIEEAVIHTARREWVSQRRFDEEIRDISDQMAAQERELAAERRSKRDQQEDRGSKKKEWRRRHASELGLIEAFSDLNNRTSVLDQFWNRCHMFGNPENQVYRCLLDDFGEIPPIVNLPVKGELAFKVHRVFWQVTIFKEIILRLYDKQIEKINRLKRANRQFYYGEEIAWLSDQPAVTPIGIYTFLKKKGVPLTKVASTFEMLADGQALAESHGSRPESLRYVTVKEYAMLPKPVPAIRRYLNALAKAGIVSPSGDIYSINQNPRPKIDQRVPDYSLLCEEGLSQYIVDP